MTFTHVGGLTMGADAVAVAVSLASDASGSPCARNPSGEGTPGRSKAPASDRERVLLVDDVISTGASTLTALEAVRAAGAEAVAAVSVVDRGGAGAAAFAEHGVRYLPLTTWEELGIPPLDGNRPG